MIERTLGDVLATSKQNKSARLLARGGDNRIEPECWPTINPSFHLESDWKVFAIGSCFARNVELALERLGFDVPTRRFIKENTAALGSFGPEVLNKYTPPSIYQELHWTRQILDSDDKVGADDVEPFLLSLKNGNVIDLQRPFLNKYGISREEALDRRRMFYKLFRKAFECEVVVITLGLIECWFDRQNEQYVEFDPVLRDYNKDDRFVFRVLDYPTSYEYVRKTVSLLNKDCQKRILITTSPVSITRTFTRHDVIIANMQSKSVLRAVAGQIADEFDGVDYFPSYESVMLTRQPYVWDDDLAHVDPAFVGRIMGRVYASYVPDASAAAIAAKEKLLHFQTLIEDERFDEAKELYCQIDAESMSEAKADFHAGAAELWLHGENRDRALLHADRAQHGAGELGEAGFIPLLRAGMIFEKLALPERSVVARNTAFELLRNRPAIAKGWLSRFVYSRKYEHAQLMLQFMEDHFGDSEEVMEFVVHTYLRLERNVDAERVCRTYLQRDPSAVAMKAPLFRLIKSDPERTDETVALVESVLEADPNNADWLKRLCADYMRLGRYDEAVSIARRLLVVEPEDVHGHLVLAHSLERSGHLDEAWVAASAGAKLDPGNERIMRVAEKIASQRSCRSAVDGSGRPESARNPVAPAPIG